jgi:hypothetical protein
MNLWHYSSYGSQEVVCEQLSEFSACLGGGVGLLEQRKHAVVGATSENTIS